MGFNCGIVGLPNVGKSTLFNALVRTAAAAAANYPFCTIEPNLGRVPVPDERLDTVARIAGSARIVPAQLEVVDIAGLVRGASRGEGLTKRVRGGEPEARRQLALIEQIRPEMEAGVPARRLRLDPEQRLILRSLPLLTAKPLLYLCNVEEAAAATGNAWSAAVERWARAQGAASLVIAAAIEAEIAALADHERSEYLAALGLERPGLDRVLQAGYRLLDLNTFLTAGPKEARAWPIGRGTTAAEAAGTIHSDFQRGFICAEVVRYQDYVRCDGEAGAREAGLMRQEGRDYVVEDGDVIHFRFNV